MFMIFMPPTISETAATTDSTTLTILRTLRKLFISPAPDQRLTEPDLLEKKSENSRIRFSAAAITCTSRTHTSTASATRPAPISREINSRGTKTRYEGMPLIKLPFSCKTPTISNGKDSARSAPDARESMVTVIRLPNAFPSGNNSCASKPPITAQ